MPATSLSSVLFPDPFAAMTPRVRPFGTVKLMSFSAVKVSSGFKVLDQAPREQRALQRRELLALAIAPVDLRDPVHLMAGRGPLANRGGGSCALGWRAAAFRSANIDAQSSAI